MAKRVAAKQSTSRNPSKARKSPHLAVVGKPFKPGQSGNPAGRPAKAVCISSWLRDYAILPVSELPTISDSLTSAQIAALNCWKKARAGGTAEYNFIMCRIEGMPVQKQDMEAIERFGELMHELQEVSRDADTGEQK